MKCGAGICSLPTFSEAGESAINSSIVCGHLSSPLVCILPAKCIVCLGYLFLACGTKWSRSWVLCNLIVLYINGAGRLGVRKITATE